VLAASVVYMVVSERICLHIITIFKRRNTAYDIYMYTDVYVDIHICVKVLQCEIN